MITLFGAVFLVAAAIVIALYPDKIAWVLAAAVPFTTSTGISIAGQSLVMYPLVAIALIATRAYRQGLRSLLRANLSSRPGASLLCFFAIWSCLVTVVSPAVFAGTPVLDPRVGIDNGVADPASLSFKISNIAQSGYLLIGIATVVVIGTTPRVSPHLPALAFGLGTVVSSLRYVLPASLTTRFLDTSKNVAYTTGDFNGTERLRGVFSEPAAFGAFSVAAAVFFIAASSRLRGGPRLCYIGLGVWAFTNAVYSFSGGALITCIVMLTIIAAKGAFTVFRGQKPLRPLTVITVLSLPIAVILYGASLMQFVNLMISDKAAGSSYANRTAADNFSYAVATRTAGLGAGLGSNRPSSFAAALLSAVGYVGTLLFVCALVIIIWRAMKKPEFEPTVWALITIIVSKAVAGPDISDPPLWFLFGVCAFAAWSSEERPALTPDLSKFRSYTGTRVTPLERSVD